jgi:hypothetical protein
MEDIEHFIESTRTKDEYDKERINFFRTDRKFFKCSSKTGEGISEILEYVAKTMAKDESPWKEDDKGIIKVTESPTAPQNSGDCCSIL